MQNIQRQMGVTFVYIELHVEHELYIGILY